MTFQPGNPGGGKRKEKLFFDALMLAIKDTDNPRSLRTIAEKLLDMAISGDIQAIKEVANRTDGMPVQALEATVENSFVVRTPDVAPTTDEWLKHNSPDRMTIQ